MKDSKSTYSKRLLSLFLAIAMVITILPFNVFASGKANALKPEVSSIGTLTQPRQKTPVKPQPQTQIGTRAVDAQGKPPLEWDSGEGDKDDGSAYWALPTGVSVIHAQAGSDPVNTVGITYLGNYKTNEDQLALKFEVSQDQTATTGVWKYYVMRMPKELYTSVDWEKSYLTRKRGENWEVEYAKFTDSTIPGQTSYTKQFEFLPVSSGYVHYELNLVLKSNINWANDFANQSQVFQLRLFNSDGSKIFSTSSRGEKVLSKFGYNTHTKVAVVGSKAKKPSDLMESTTISRYGANVSDDMFRTTYSVLQLDKENKKVRVIYVPTKSNTDPVVAGNNNYNYRGEDLAIRQSFDPEFVKYLDLTDPDGVIGKFRVLDQAENPYGDEIEIYAKDLTGVKKDAQGKIALDQDGNPTYDRDDKAVFLQLSEYNYEDQEDAKLDATDKNKITTKAQPKNKGTNIFRKAATVDGYFVVFEYNIDPERINNELIKDNQFVKNFMFDTRYITDNNDGMRKFTAKSTKDITVAPNTKAFMRFVFTPDVSISDNFNDSAFKHDFMVNVGGVEGNWYSWKREGAEWKNVGTLINKKYEYYIPLYGYQSWKVKDDANQPLAGKSIKAGTDISLYLPTYFNSGNVKFDIITTNGNPKNATSTPVKDTEVTLVKQTDQKNKDKDKEVFRFPMYQKNTVSTIGGSAIREQFTPIVDEVFTDSKEITGIMKTEGGVASLLYKPDVLGTKAYMGSNWLESVINEKTGEVSAYHQIDGKDPFKELKSDDAIQSRRFNGKSYKGVRFNIKNQYTGGDSLAASEQKSDVGTLSLLKDQPILLNTYKLTSLKSETVFEQVQAKVKFNLYPEQNVALERIVPLNKQYSVIPPEVASSTEVTPLADTSVGKKNPTYKPNGFLPKQGEDNIRIDEKNPTIVVQRQSLTETDAFNKTKTKTYPNFINHDGFTYDINNSDQAIKDEATQNFLKRLFPDAEFDSALSKKADGKPREDNKVVIGWTTKELKDTATLSAEDQFYKLEKDKKVLTETKQWDDGQIYIFNEYSPVDKNRQVFAVWGVPSLVLHANNTTEDKETIVRIPYTEADVTKTDQIIDAMTSATKDNLKNNNVIKELPLAPYRYDSKQLGETYDERLDAFVKEKSTFVGWTMERYMNDESSKFVAGNNNARIGEIKKGMTTDGKSLPKRTESSQYMDGKRDAYVPNGFNFAVSKGFEALMKEGKDIHLYANYRPYFDVKVQPRYRNISDPVQGFQYGKYEDNVKADKKKGINVALLYRTAVTDYTKPTVLQGATYNPLTSQDAIKPYDGTSTTPLTWNVPGYDREGLRQSYVAVVVPEGKTEAYKNFKQAKDPQKPDEGINDWNSLGISTYVKVSGNSAELDKNAPRNLHETIPQGDPYGVGLAKQQTFTVKTGSTVDAYTSATSRQSVLRGTREVKGYNIFLTNTPQTIPAPVFDNVKGTDTSFSVNFDQELIDQKLSGLKLKVPYAVEDGAPGKYKTEYKDINLTIGDDGKTITAPEGITASVANGKLTVGNFDFTKLPDGEPNRTIYGNFTKAVAGGDDIVSSQGKVVITQLLASNPVTDMAQIPKKDNENARLRFYIPAPGPADQVVKGTVYTAQKFDTDQNKWVDVGEFVVPEPKLENSPQEMSLTGNVAHDDIIRIVSKEPGKTPGYSVGDETNTPYTPMQPNPDKPNEPVADFKHYAKLDLQGPNVKGKAEDETFRRYINIQATLDEMPGDKITIELGTIGQQGTEGNKTAEATKATAIEVLNEIVRENEETLHGIWIIAQDEMGNKTVQKIDYTQTYQLKVTATGARPNRNFFRLKSEKANTSVKLIVREGQTVILEQTLTLAEANKYEKITFMKEGQPYALQSGQELDIEGSCVENTKTYTTNPFTVLIH